MQGGKMTRKRAAEMDRAVNECPDCKTSGDVILCGKHCWPGLENIKYDLVEAVDPVCGHQVLMCAELLGMFTREGSPCPLCLDADAERKVLALFRTAAGTCFHGVTVDTQDSAGLYRRTWGSPCLHGYVCDACDHAALMDCIRQRNANHLAHLQWKDANKMERGLVNAKALHNQAELPFWD